MIKTKTGVINLLKTLGIGCFKLYIRKEAANSAKNR